MEQNHENPGTSLFTLNLDAGNSYTLRSAASWAKVLAIAGLIVAILFIIFGVALQSYTGSADNYNSRSSDSRVVGNVGMITYMVSGITLLISSIFALNFGNKITRALKTNDQQLLSAGFTGIRNYFAFWAILMIICLLLLLIAFAAVMSRV
jgi:hypothetical protein